jgi:hypothetical protein
MLRDLAKRVLPWQVHLGAILLMAGLALVVYLIEIGPLYTRYCDRHMRVTQLAQQVNRGRELDATVKRTRDAATDVRHFLTSRSIVLEPRARLNDRLTAICALADECGLVPEGIEPQRQAVEPMFTKVTLRLSGHGGYENCVRFLDRLRNEMPNNTVASIELSASPSAAEPVVSFSFQIIWHAAPNP